MLPLWFVMALSAAMVMTAVPLVQERFKADGLALALWLKVFLSILALPSVFYFGLPTDPVFYFYMAVTAILYAVSDVVYFRSVPVVGSGVVTRLLPISVVVTFFVWFIVDPDLWRDYWASPLKMVGIAAIFAAFLFFATRLKQCSVSWQGLRLLWPVILAACIGPVFSKMAMAYAGDVQAPFAYIAVQSPMMAAFMAFYYRAYKPIPRSTMFAPVVIRMGMVMSVILGLVILLKMKAFQLVDNPGFASMVMFSDALFVLLIYRLIGRKESANIRAGLGIVACAIGVLVVKELL